jgi:hypothetical protein
MSIVVQICVVIVTIAVVLMAYATIRLMLQIKISMKKLEGSYGYLQELLEDSRETSRKVREVLTTLEQIALTVRSGTSQLEKVVDRAAAVSTLVLDEIQQPVIQAVTLMRALRSGARGFARRWTQKQEAAVHTPEGENHV